MYEEFDEEVLRSIQKKVESLRNGKGDIERDGVCVVTYCPNQTKTNSNYSKGGIGIFGHPLGNPSTSSTDRYVDPKTLCKSPKRTVIADGMGEKEENVYEDPATLLGKKVTEVVQNHLYENPRTLLEEQQRKEGLMRGPVAAPKHNDRVPQNQVKSQPHTESADRMEESLYDEDDDVFYEDPHSY